MDHHWWLRPTFTALDILMREMAASLAGGSGGWKLMQPRCSISSGTVTMMWRQCSVAPAQGPLISSGPVTPQVPVNRDPAQYDVRPPPGPCKVAPWLLCCILDTGQSRRRLLSKPLPRCCTRLRSDRSNRRYVSPEQMLHKAYLHAALRYNYIVATGRKCQDGEGAKKTSKKETCTPALILGDQL